MVAGAGWITCFIERLWRSLKYEDIYLKAYSSHEARAGITRRIEFYNLQRPHQALENSAPMAVWRAAVIGAFGGEDPVDLANVPVRSNWCACSIDPDRATRGGSG